jgi:hypothetical protein
MQSAFAYVIWIVCGLGIVVAFVALVGVGRVWDEYGRNRLVMERDPVSHASPAALAERDEEIRQLLEAKNARRLRRGEAPVDVDAELRRLVTPEIDEGLRAEIRELVVARNFRRMRQGRPPLDIAAEIEREIAQLADPGAR